MTEHPDGRTSEHGTSHDAGQAHDEDEDRELRERQEADVERDVGPEANAQALDNDQDQLYTDGERERLRQMGRP